MDAEILTESVAVGRKTLEVDLPSSPSSSSSSEGPIDHENGLVDQRNGQVDVKNGPVDQEEAPVDQIDQGDAPTDQGDARAYNFVPPPDQNDAIPFNTTGK